MRCPFCGHHDTQVKDSRPSEDGVTIRRRRFCPECESRFTTFERVQIRELTVIKGSGEKRPFDREKISRSIGLATRKRPVSQDQIEQLVNNIVRKLERQGETEIRTAVIGEEIMEGLKALDEVSYIRFASVYRNFREGKDFEKFVGRMDK
jgi:transcriptional repressor NrdR